MKKSSIFRFLIVVMILFALGLISASCGGDDVTYRKVVFSVNGREYFTKYVEDGKGISELPETPTIKGYEVSWEDVGLESISTDLTINAIIMPCTYIITYNTDGGEINSTTQGVAFGADYTLEVPEKANAEFLGWYTEDGELFANSGKWFNDDNVTLTARWQGVYYITYRQEGFDDVVISLRNDEIMAKDNIPTAQPVKGHSVLWESVDYESIVNTSTIVNAVITPKMFKLKIDFGYENGRQEFDIIYNAYLSIEIPDRDGYTFLGFKDINGEFVQETRYVFDQDMELYAEWKMDVNNDKWWSEGVY